MSNQARASVAGEPLKDTLPALHLSQQPPRSVDCAHVPLTESSPSQGQRGSAWLQYGFTLHREALFLFFFFYTLNGLMVWSRLSAGGRRCFIDFLKSQPCVRVTRINLCVDQNWRKRCWPGNPAAPQPQLFLSLDAWTTLGVGGGKVTKLLNLDILCKKKKKSSFLIRQKWKSRSLPSVLLLLSRIAWVEIY